MADDLEERLAAVEARQRGLVFGTGAGHYVETSRRGPKPGTPEHELQEAERRRIEEREAARLAAEEEARQRADRDRQEAAERRERNAPEVARLRDEIDELTAKRDKILAAADPIEAEISRRRAAIRKLV